MIKENNLNTKKTKLRKTLEMLNRRDSKQINRKA